MREDVAYATSSLTGYEIAQLSKNWSCDLKQYIISHHKSKVSTARRHYIYISSSSLWLHKKSAIFLGCTAQHNVGTTGEPIGFWGIWGHCSGREFHEGHSDWRMGPTSVIWGHRGSNTIGSVTKKCPDVCKRSNTLWIKGPYTYEHTPFEINSKLHGYR